MFCLAQARALAVRLRCVARRRAVSVWNIMVLEWALKTKIATLIDANVIITRTNMKPFSLCRLILFAHLLESTDEIQMRTCHSLVLFSCGLVFYMGCYFHGIADVVLLPDLPFHTGIRRRPGR